VIKKKSPVKATSGRDTIRAQPNSNRYQRRQASPIGTPIAYEDVRQYPRST
jgi:hypothetical protein